MILFSFDLENYQKINPVKADNPTKKGMKRVLSEVVF
jgi:hypothetical protein